MIFTNVDPRHAGRLDDKQGGDTIAPMERVKEAKYPPKWRKCESFRGNCLRGWRPELAMDQMDQPRTSINERMLSGRRAVIIV